MSEKQTNSPEADPQAIDDLYQQAADYLETMLHHGKAAVEPSTSTAATLDVSAEVPEVSGRKLRVSYERARKEDDLTQVDRGIPLAYNDETGANVWQTPIRIEELSTDGNTLHYFILEHSLPKPGGGVFAPRANDEAYYNPEDPYAVAGITELDANNLIAHIEHGLEQIAEAN